MSDNLKFIEVLDKIEDEIFDVGCHIDFPLEQFDKLANARRLIIEVKNELRRKQK